MREHRDRTWIRATVDIREREDATESWSDLQLQGDRIRSEGAANQISLSWTRPGAGGVVISAATIALFLSAPAAFADDQPASQPAVTVGQVVPATSDTTSTTAPPATGTGTPVSATTADDGTITVVVSTAGDPGATGSSSTSTGPPADDPPSSNAQDVQSEADTTQSGAQNGNVSVRVGQGGNSGQVDQGNAATSSASSTASGNLPATGDGPSAGASATTTQQGASNGNVAVRVDSPGDIAPVGQGNQANANAGANGPNGDSGNHGNGNNGNGGGNASASATQTDPDNVNVVVRVGSPGDNGAVTQQNTVAAAAGADAATPAPDPVATVGPAQTDQTVTTSNSGADASNAATVEQQLVQTQDGPGPDVETVGDSVVEPAPSSAVGSATATQSGARNVNVSIRVGSPGTDGAVSQTNGATAVGTSPDLGVVHVTGGSNLNLAVVLPGTTSAAPGETWSWNWNWTGDGTPAAGATAASAAPTDGSTWNWSWTTAPASTTTPAQSSATGLFVWTWTWTRPDGTVWSLDERQACSCSWTWTWVWDWSAGPPETTAPAAAATGDAPAVDTTGATSDDGPVVQSNTASATADAAADVTLTGLLDVQQSGVDPSLELQDAENGQSFANTQSVVAYAEADQLDPWNLNAVWGVPVATVTQTNAVDAAARAQASVALDQELIQGQDGSDGTGTYQWLGAQQTATNDQEIGAGALAVQQSAGNTNIVSAPSPNEAAVSSVEQTNGATAGSSATAAATLYQGLAQFEDALGSGVELIDLTQLVDSFQSALVAATVTQTRTRNLDELLVPAGSRATNPTVRQRNLVSTTVSSEDTGNLTSVAFQYQGGAADIELTSGFQQIQLVQNATASAPAHQTDLLNETHWLGVEPPPPAGGDDGGDQSGVSTPSSGTTADSTPAVAGFTRLNGIYSPSTAPRALRAAPPARTRPLVPQGPATRVAFTPPAFAGAAAPHGAPAAVATVPPAVTAIASVTQVEAVEQPAAAPVAAARGAGPAPVPPSPNLPGDPSSAGTGTSASAPSSGGGQTVLAFGSYKLAAQLVTGPQMPTSVLGRPVIFLEPFERPG